MEGLKFVEEFSEEKSKISQEFSRLKNEKTYLDVAGAMLYGENQIRKINEVLISEVFCNPHTSASTEKIIDQVRLRTLNFLNADPSDYSIIFTSGATAALKLVAESFNFSPSDAFFHLTDSHTSVLGMREVVKTSNIKPITREKFLNDELTSELSAGLITFPAQCNFNGTKFPLENIRKCQEVPDLYVMLDAASFVSTNHLDLGVFKPDYVCLSFYKIFGFPDGLGALVVSNRGADRLLKKYYGGGTVKIALTRSNFHEKRDLLHERFEDGTIPFLSIIGLQTSFQYLEDLLGSSYIHRISQHVFNLASYLHKRLKSLKHHNNTPLVTFYHDSDFTDVSTQGGIVNFNLRHADGTFIGFAEFSHIAAIHNIILRTGCFCNPGSCQTHLNLTEDELMKQFHAGHVCGDENDLIEGQPTGSVRVSFGYMTTKENVDKLVEVIETCYLETVERRNGDKIDDKPATSQPYLKSIRIYPIKSCAPMVVTSSWPIEDRGLKFDREWMIIDGKGASLTQKTSNRMCMIAPSIDEERKIMKLSFPGARDVEISLEPNKDLQRNATICETKVCGDIIQGWDCGEEVSRWLCDVLEMKDLKLLRQNTNIPRKNGSISLSNQGQFLLISEPSVKWLMNQVEEWDFEAVDNTENVVKRFRGNFVVDDLEPLLERDSKSFKIGNVEFDVQGPCTRCQMICIDQNTGEKSTEPLRTIGRLFKGKMRFGVYLKSKSGERVAVNCGDRVEIF